MLNVTSIGIKLERSKTNGFYDLLVMSYGGMYFGGVDTYKFAKGKYQITKCYAWRPYDEAGDKIKIQVKPRNCNERT